jgi:hypothetical protein
VYGTDEEIPSLGTIGVCDAGVVKDFWFDRFVLGLYYDL